MTLRDLSEYMYNRTREKNPTVPVYAVPRKSYTDKTSNGLTTAIVDFCNSVPGVMADRTGNEGRYREGETVVDVIGRTRVMKGMFIPGLRKGAADIEVTIAGRIYYVEVKVGKDRQRPDQVKFMHRVRAAGSVYELVKTWDQFYLLFYTWMQQHSKL